MAMAKCLKKSQLPQAPRRKYLKKMIMKEFSEQFISHKERLSLKYAK
jgi:hypothetical protein